MDEKLTVLVVDDEQVVLDSVRLHLRRENYEIRMVLTAEDGMTEVRKGDVDIVLTDLMMPEMDGLELMAAIKEIDPAIPIVMITGYATINTALQANQLGAFDYIAKPFTRVELKGVVKRAAELVESLRSNQPEEAVQEEPEFKRQTFKVIGENTWLMTLKSGLVRIGTESSFLATFGKIQSIDIPEAGDRVRQGSVCFQVFSSDLKSQSLLSPISGEIKRVNEAVLKDPSKLLQDPYEKGWLMEIDPVDLEEELKILGL